MEAESKPDSSRIVQVLRDLADKLESGEYPKWESDETSELVQTEPIEGYATWKPTGYRTLQLRYYKKPYCYFREVK